MDSNSAQSHPSLLRNSWLSQTGNDEKKFQDFLLVSEKQNESLFLSPKWPLMWNLTVP